MHWNAKVHHRGHKNAPVVSVFSPIILFQAVGIVTKDHVSNLYFLTVLSHRTMDN